ncbi:MAG: hypothetical protein V3R41_03800 [Gammaproteobacteria bacterium]
MGQRGKHKSRYTDPRPGTKVHRAIQLLMRVKGATAQEMGSNDCFRYLRDDCGYDIRVIDTIPNGKGGPDRKVWRIVGRHHFNGSGYDDYLAKELFGTPDNQKEKINELQVTNVKAVWR